jgi:REDY-like protein HapK
MPYVMIRYNLKDGVSPDDFENWVRDTDHPTMRALKRVKSFETYRATGLLMGEGAPSQSYFELFDIDDLAGFTGEDLAGDTVQVIMGQFSGFADNPEFVVAERL